jgi:hypothetical protein
MLAEDLAQSGRYADDIFPMEQALDTLTKLEKAGIKTGPGSSEVNEIKNFLRVNASWLPGVDKIIGDEENLKNADKLNKYFTQIAGVGSNSFGHGTDQALATSLRASPNMKISDLANDDLIKATIALRRMKQAQALDAQAQKIDDYKYPTWKSQWASTIDPRAFMIDKMDKNKLIILRKLLIHLLNVTDLIGLWIKRLKLDCLRLLLKKTKILILWRQPRCDNNGLYATGS